ncbi:MAG: hypothetical protein KDD37_11830 [Bdellovibrionales bacterium]|nr:hypothetical protein [Bdellovibrionales bacterium]
MKYLILLLVGLTSSFAVADECIQQSRIRSYRADSATSLMIDAGRQDYHMQVSYCRELAWAQRIAFRTFSPSRVCRGDRLLVLDNFSNRVIQECFIHQIFRE